jgi:hypothetical protein
MVDKEYTAGEAKAWLNGYDEGRKIRTSERIIQTSDTEPTESPRAWVGLTDEEREEATGWSVEHIETKLKEKNNG